MWNALRLTPVLALCAFGQADRPADRLSVSNKSPSIRTTPLEGGRWRSVLLLEVTAKEPVSATSFRTRFPDARLARQLALADRQLSGPEFVRMEFTGTGRLPMPAWLEHSQLTAPFRFEIPPPVLPHAPAWSPWPSFTDHVVFLALGFASLAVACGGVLARTSLWTSMGSQTWSLSSWTTNASAGAGFVSLLTTLVPELKSPAALLVAILGFAPSSPPLAYNLTSREAGADRKSRVLFFLLSAALTGTAALGQILTVLFLLPAADSIVLPALSRSLLQGMLGAAGVALLYYLASSVRDTIIAQTRPPESRGMLGVPLRGAPFPAL